MPAGQSGLRRHRNNGTVTGHFDLDSASGNYLDFTTGGESVAAGYTFFASMSRTLYGERANVIALAADLTTITATASAPEPASIALTAPLLLALGFLPAALEASVIVIPPLTLPNIPSTTSRRGPSRLRPDPAPPFMRWVLLSGWVSSHGGIAL